VNPKLFQKSLRFLPNIFEVSSRFLRGFFEVYARFLRKKNSHIKKGRKVEDYVRYDNKFLIHIKNAHFLPVSLYSFKYYDSMAGLGKAYIDTLFRYLQEEHQDKKNCPIPDT
jgi:hypothetical protein